MEWRNKTKCFYGIVIYHWRVREGLPFSIYSAIFSENCKIDQNSNLTPVKVLAAHSCKTKNWWSSTLTFPKIAFLHGGDWLMSVIRNRLHVAMGVISHRWQKTSKCGKNIPDTLCCALHDTSCFCHILTAQGIDWYSCSLNFWLLSNNFFVIKW